MTFAEKSSNGAFNGATYVDVVAVPGASTTRVIRNVVVYNGDTVAHVFELSYDDNGTVRVLFKQSIDAGATFDFDSIMVLDATTRKLKARIEGAHTTTAPNFVANYGEVT